MSTYTASEIAPIAVTVAGETFEVIVASSVSEFTGKTSYSRTIANAEGELVEWNAGAWATAAEVVASLAKTNRGQAARVAAGQRAVQWDEAV